MPTKRKKKRKNRKIKFSEDRYIEKFYMSGNKAVIPVELKEAEDLYMKHDYLKMELSDSVCKYIEEIAYMIPIDTEIELEIHCPRVDVYTQQKMARAIKNNYGIEIDDVDYELREDKKKSLILLAIGLVLLVINILTEDVLGQVFSNFLSVVWWVLIWDVSEMYFFDRTEYQSKRLNYQQLYDAKTVFIFNDEEESRERERELNKLN
jgi:hypothetical protein